MDINELRKWHKVFFPNGELFEVRLIGANAKKDIVSGYFKDVDIMAKQLEFYLNDTRRHYQAYFLLNELSESLFSREQHNKFVYGALTTKDDEITRRKWFFIDFDSKKPRGVSASAKEVELAKKKLGKVYNFLKAEGFKEPVMCFSGNGYHLLLKVDMPNDKEHNDLIKDFTDTISDKFSDENVEIDKSVFNVARLCKLYGTEARKGANTAERPWRLSKIEYIPKSLELNDESLFKAVVEKYGTKEEVKKQPTSVANTNSHTKFDLESWFIDHNVEYRYAGIEKGMQKYQLRHCPWEDSHSTIQEWTDAAIFIMPDGKLTYKCFHAHCVGRTWHDFRKFYEPDYDPNKRDKYQKPIRNYQQRQKPQPDIKPEMQELGKKWLSPLDIPKINLYDLPKTKTGFTALDREIRGLHFFEYSVLSGTNGCGKSSWLNTLILNIVNMGTKVALWSGELPSVSLQTWIDMAAAGRNHLKEGHDSYGEPYYYVSDEVSKKIRTWLNDKLFIYNTAYGQKWEQLFNDMLEQIGKGIKFFILDNLTSMDVDIIDGDRNQKEKAVVDQLHHFCMRYKCHIILVVHPRKSTARGQRSLLRKEDISGAGAITDLADNVFIIHRNNEDFRKGIAEFYGKEEAAKYEYGGEYGDVGNVIEILKNRMFGNADRIVRLYFDTRSRRFKNAPDEEIEYKWNENAAQQGDLGLNSTMPFEQATDEAPF